MKYLYHPHEILLDGTPQACEVLREHLIAHIPATLRVAMVRHGIPDADLGVTTGLNLALAGTRTLWDYPGHPDPAALGVLLQAFDLVMLEHSGSTLPAVIKLLDDAPYSQTLDGALALYGCEPPERTPAGGIPYFAQGQEDDLLQWLVDELGRQCSEVPLLGLIAGARAGQDITVQLESLRDICSQVFVVMEPSQAVNLPAWVQSIPRTLAGLGFVGDLLNAAQAIPSASWMVVSGREGEATYPARLAGLLDGRDPLSDATAWAGSSDSLPRNDAVLWERKGLGRLWGFLGSGLRCPQRILNQCRVRLLEP